ncbi:Uncharacterised protein [uncultured archaeon]|nr:Uncharacterised protein [uncultured archaeon]
MKTLEKLAGIIVLSSSFIIPSYSEAGETNQAPSGCYYCSKCGNYHRYERLQNLRQKRTEKTIGNQISDTTSTNMANSVNASQVYDNIGNSAKAAEGLKPLNDFLNVWGALFGNSSEKDKKTKADNYSAPKK